MDRLLTLGILASPTDAMPASTWTAWAAVDDRTVSTVEDLSLLWAQSGRSGRTYRLRWRSDLAGTTPNRIHLTEDGVQWTCDRVEEDGRRRWLRLHCGRVDPAVGVV